MPDTAVISDVDTVRAAALDDLRLVIAPFVRPTLSATKTALDTIAGLSGGERQAVWAGLAFSLRAEVLERLIRVLLLDLHAARQTGELTAPDPAARWAQWIVSATGPRFVAGLTERYPTLSARLGTLVDRRAAAAVSFAQRFAADRDALADLLPPEVDRTLVEVSFGAGDSHRGGHTVAIARLANGALVYKPRDLGADHVLGDLLRALLAGEPQHTRIRVPAVLRRDGYGWAEHIQHRYAADASEMRAFYRGIGQWLAVSRLLGATDLHAENVIAAGPVPVVVDCETLLTPAAPATSAPWGRAYDRAAGLLRESVLRTGLLPGRAEYLGLRGTDLSAVGALPGQQPETIALGLVDLGTDQARLAQLAMPAQPLANLPAERPPLIKYWPLVLDAFTELTDRLTALDQAGALVPLLAGFADVPVRTVLRDTIIYAELGAMLWHPASLYDEAAAGAHAQSLLAQHGANTPGAPTDPDEIAAEVADLLIGDVPLFTIRPDQDNLLDQAVRRWRALDPRIDRQVVECVVLSAFQDEELGARHTDLRPTHPDRTRLDQRRRALAGSLIRQAKQHAIHGEDGTLTWVSMTLGPAGLTMLPLGGDLYDGLSGVAVSLAGYVSEVAAGRADPVDGVDDLLAATLRSLVVMEDVAAKERAEHPDARPEPPGAYVGIASRIWAWLRLADLGAVPATLAHERATVLADALGPALAADDFHDVLIGRAGAMVPLLRLAQRTGTNRFQEQAIAIGDQLLAHAVLTHAGARWPGVRSEAGIGGFSHGAAGIGWALVRLGRMTGLSRFVDAGMAGVRLQDSLRVPAGWIDLRKPGETAQNWCHGSDGVGVLAADLSGLTADQVDTGPGMPGDPAPQGDPSWLARLRHAGRAAWLGGFGDTHTLCHGDLGSWEVLDLAIRAGVGPEGVTRTDVDARVLSSIEQFGPRAAMTNTQFRPGLMTGMGGMAWQLLRMHPGCPLPSLLVPDPR